MVRFFTSFVLICCFGYTTSQAQNFYAYKRDRRLSALFGLGTTTYYGELSNPGKIMDGSPNVNVGLNYRLGQHTAARFDLMWFRVTGDDKKASGETGRRERNLNLRGDNFELDFLFKVNARPLDVRFYRRPPINPYGFIGIGFVYMNPKGELDGKWYSLRKYQTEGVKYSPIAIAIPFGFGVNVRVNPFFNIVAEGGYRKVFSDYLDDISTTYTNTGDPTSLRSRLADKGPEIGVTHGPGEKRGEPSNDDSYFIATIKVEYFLATSALMKRTYKRARYR